MQYILRFAGSVCCIRYACLFKLSSQYLLHCYAHKTMKHKKGNLQISNLILKLTCAMVNVVMSGKQIKWVHRTRMYAYKIGQLSICVLDCTRLDRVYFCFKCCAITFVVFAHSSAKIFTENCFGIK